MAIIIIEQRTRAVDTDSWGTWTESTDAAPHTDTSILEYRVKPTVDYVSEYEQTYESVLLRSMESFTADSTKRSPLERLFTLIDETADETTTIEKLSLKKDAYMGLLQSVTAASQKTAMSLVDKTYKFDGELVQQTKQLALMDQQVFKATADVSYVEAQEKAMKEQVIDNRVIKSVDTLGDTYGTFGAGGMTISAAMWDVYFSSIARLNGVRSVFKGYWDASTTWVHADRPLATNTATFPYGGDDNYFTAHYYIVSKDGAAANDNPKQPEGITGNSEWKKGYVVMQNGDGWTRVVNETL